MKLTRTFDVTLSPDDVAALFCEMNDDEQAQFFEHVGRRMAEWGAFKRDTQVISIAEHMNECECTKAGLGREWVLGLGDALCADRPALEARR